MNFDSCCGRCEFFVVVMGWVIRSLEWFELGCVFFEDGGAKGLCEGA